MARQKSVVLTPAEKKVALKDAKEELKVAKNTAKEAEAAIKTANAAFKKEIKALEGKRIEATQTLEKLKERIDRLSSKE
jgi:multidrug resistance efflux pump